MKCTSSAYMRDNNNGRLIVQLPLTNKDDLVQSYQVALALLEIKFKKHFLFYKQYKQAMQDYMDSNVMEFNQLIKSVIPQFISAAFGFRQRN